MKTLTDAIVSLYPNCFFVLHNEDYEMLEWYSKEHKKPSKEILLAELTRLQELDNKMQYKTSRAQEYPPLEDLADALYWQNKGDNSKMQIYLTACEAVKQKYPKGA